ncbi:hypothetical protein NUU61_005104 [Penicillium alfredii]|uniref:Xylanolytic transcriptional activator regulatory domain-containing protein n=1 Tax=Penicillium alfredii TaxID=1506179 RepID=A0A9W9F8S1_9EURO|nr:uncharacterized protein NUU61_005104 [Penicillium alfredii]KAJ5095748.1 hypothetical protein NUU61_005104 [Penicillium alfredii]
MVASALAELCAGTKSTQSDNRETQSTLSSGSADINAELIDENPPAPSRDEATASQPPIQSLYQITPLRSLRSQRLDDAAIRRGPSDLISRKMLSIRDAEVLVNNYLQRTDHYLYGIASEYASLENLRQASPLLLTAILTVAALQSPDGQQQYRVCYPKLRRLIADFLFSAVVILEDLRGLCIACFWLSDISWSILGLAIRRAVKLKLPKYFSMAVEYLKPELSPSVSDQLARRLIDGVRLWYLLYVRDQHLAILYGRRSILRDGEEIQNWMLCLAVWRGSITDIRILSQVALLQILRSIPEIFGQDSKRRVPTLLKSQLDAFNQQLDLWVTHWLGISQNHLIIGTYPSKAITLHHHFSKLLVSSHVFRGIGPDPSQDPLPTKSQDLAAVAINSAKSVVELTVTDPDLIDAYIGIPHSYHTMIAFACSFLMKVATK